MVNLTERQKEFLRRLLRGPGLSTEIRTFLEVAVASKLNPELALRILIGMLVAAIEEPNGEVATITSAYRDPARQRALIAKWDAGDREGLVVRPSETSWHLQGRAIDISTNYANFAQLRDILENLGLEWGGRWKRPDPVHFQWTYGGTRRSIKQLLAAG